MLRIFYSSIVLLCIYSSIDTADGFFLQEMSSKDQQCLNFCSEHGICQIVDNTPVCYCLPGWAGASCNDTRKAAPTEGANFLKRIQTSKQITICPTSIQGLCQNGGRCILLNNELQCICNSNFTGSFCDESSPCTTFPCQNNSTCVPSTNPNESPKCLCNQGYSGILCERNSTIATTTTMPPTIPSEACKYLPNFCLNGGTCVASSNATNSPPKCLCPPGFAPPKCEKQGSVSSTGPTNTNGPNPPSSTTSSSGPNPNPGITCANNPCRNSRPCYNTGDSYFCFCGTQFTGKNCDQFIG